MAGVMQASQQAQGVGRKKTRKRKKIKVDYYGYDPSIVVMEGDPRLNPPPAWFGVNYHPSQPISNSWIEWSGADVAMFDISNNKAIPLPKDCSLAQDSMKRRKHKLDSAPSSGAVSAPDKKKKKQISNMTLHPFQPTRNEWTDWNSMDVDESSQGNGTNNSSANASASSSPRDVTPAPAPKVAAPAWATAGSLSIDRLSRSRGQAGFMSPLKTGTALGGMISSANPSATLDPISLGPRPSVHTNTSMATSTHTNPGFHARGSQPSAASNLGTQPPPPPPPQQQQQQRQGAAQQSRSLAPHAAQHQQGPSPASRIPTTAVGDVAMRDTHSSDAASVSSAASSSRATTPPPPPSLGQSPNALSSAPKASSAGANGTSENGEHGRIPALIPVPPPLSRPKPNESTTEEDLMTSLQEAWDVTELKRSWAMSTADLDQPIEVRNKILAKLNRMRKAMYQFQIEQHRNHLLELMRVLTTRKESYTAHERALIGLALAGDSTDSHALSHEHCEHRHKDDELPTAKAGTPAATDGFDPIKARAKLKVELATKMHVRRMMVFLEQDSKTRAAIADRAFKQITLAVKELTNYATALVMLGSTSMSSGLADAVQLTPAQREQFLHGYEDRLADCMRAMALYRVVGLLRSRLFLPEAASTNAKVTETLSGKQILKLLSKVASREVFVDSTDPMEDLLGQIRRLSLLTRSASSQNMETKS